MSLPSHSDHERRLADAMLEHAYTHDPPAPKVSVERVREAIRDLPLAGVLAEADRVVRDRNLVDKPQVIDAVYLDDLWQVLDDLEQRIDGEVTLDLEHPFWIAARNMRATLGVHFDITGIDGEQDR